MQYSVYGNAVCITGPFLALVGLYHCADIQALYVVSATFYIACCAILYEHDVSQSVRPSVCNIGGLWSHSTTIKWTSANGRVVRCFGYLHAEADSDRDPKFY